MDLKRGHIFNKFTNYQVILIYKVNYYIFTIINITTQQKNVLN